MTNRAPPSAWSLDSARGDSSLCSLAMSRSRNEPGSLTGLALLRKATEPSFGLPLRPAATPGERWSRRGESEHPEP